MFQHQIILIRSLPNTRKRRKAIPFCALWCEFFVNIMIKSIVQCVCKIIIRYPCLSIIIIFYYVILLTAVSAYADDYYVDIATGIDDVICGKAPANPWKTIGYALGVNGIPRTGTHNLYIKPGIYTEFNNTYIYGSYIIYGCDAAWTPAPGNVTFHYTGTEGNSMLITAGNATGLRKFYGITFSNNEQSIDKLLCLAHSGTSNSNVEISFCKFLGTTHPIRYPIDISLGTSGNSVVINNCTFENIQLESSTSTIVIRGCGNININNCKFSDFTSAFSSIVSAINPQEVGTDFTFSRNFIDITTETANCALFFQNVAYENLFVLDNIYTNNNMACNQGFVRCDSSNHLKNIYIQRNIINALYEGNDAKGLIQLNTPTVEYTGIKSIAENTISSRAAGGYIIMIGSDTATEPLGYNYLSGVIVEKNKIYGVNYFNPEISGTTHAVFSGWQTAVTYKYNYLNGCPYGLLFKGGESTNFNNAPGTGAFENTIINTKAFYAIASKGVSGVNCYNNNIFTSLSHGPLIALLDNSSLKVANMRIKKNILVGVDEGCFLRIESGNNLGNQIDNNIYFNQSGIDNNIFINENDVDSPFTSFNRYNGWKNLNWIRNEIE